MIGRLWDSVMQSPWSPELAGLGLSLMLALCMSLGFACCWVCLWRVLPTSWLTESHSVHHLLYSVVQVWAGCVEAGSLVCTRFHDSLLLLFSCLFWVISPLFSCISNQSWIEVSVASTPSFTFFHCYLLVVPLLVCFLFQQVYWCSLLPPCKFSGVAKWNLSHCLGY